MPRVPRATETAIAFSWVAPWGATSCTQRRNRRESIPPDTKARRSLCLALRPSVGCDRYPFTASPCGWWAAPMNPSTGKIASSSRSTSSSRWSPLPHPPPLPRRGLRGARPRQVYQGRPVTDELPRDETAFPVFGYSRHPRCSLNGEPVIKPIPRSRICTGPWSKARQRRDREELFASRMLVG